MKKCASPTLNARQLRQRGDDLAGDEMEPARARLEANLGLVPGHAICAFSTSART